MNKYTHGMIDMETCSTRADGGILTMAAIKFDPYADHSNMIDKDQNILLPTFYRRICLDSCVDIGLHFDDNTLDWWADQAAKNPAVMAEAFSSEDRVPIKQALQELFVFMGGVTYPWSNGAGFDIPMIEYEYAQFGMSTPWKFWNVRDTRTMYDYGKVRLKDVTNELNLDQAHHALYDCYCQIIALQRAFKNLNITA